MNTPGNQVGTLQTSLNNGLLSQRSPFDDAIRGQAIGGQYAAAAKHEAQEVIDAVAGLNSAVNRARKAGWSIGVSLYEAPSGAGGSEPDPTICATISKAV